jgi:RNA polymerase sigma-70 factor (ECF subfamily)|nr:RNA polymerase sigma factor [Candidatus Krumholzibacteria bacterium]
MNDRHQYAKTSVSINALESADTPWPEARLAQGLIQGDTDAREAFVMLSHDAVYAFACRRTQDHHLRQDWTHDVILRLLDDLKGGCFVYRRPGSFWAWFRKRAWFLVLEEGRRHRVRETRERPTPAEDLPESPGTDDTARLTEDHEAAFAVERCLEALSNPDHARALRLRMSDDTSYEEIAEALEAPLNTVRAWIRRGRVGLRQCLVQRFGWNLPEEES